MSAQHDWFYKVFGRSKEWAFNYYNEPIGIKEVYQISPEVEGSTVYEGTFKNYGITTAVYVEILNGNPVSAYMNWWCKDGVSRRRHIALDGDCNWIEEEKDLK